MCLTASIFPSAALAADSPLSQTVSAQTSAQPIAPTADYLKVAELKTGLKIQAKSPDRPTVVLSPIGNLAMLPGSSLEYLKTGYWKATVGKYHLAARNASPSKLKLISQKARLTTAGATFNLEVAADGVMRVEVLGGSVVLSRANGAYPVTVKAGYKATSGIGRTAKPLAAKSFDNWYADIPASSDLLEESWALTKAATRYERDCTVTTISAMPVQQLTPEEEASLKGFNEALDIFKVKNIDTYLLPQGKLSTSKEKTTASGRLGGQILFDATHIYYPGAATNTWKSFQNKELTDYIFKLARDKDIAFDFDKPSFRFAEWAALGQKRHAVFSGTLSVPASDALIRDTVSQDMPPATELAAARIFVAEEGGQPWAKYDDSIKVYSGKVMFTLVRTCRLTYGPGADIRIPKAEPVASDIGLAEMQTILNSVR